MRAAPTVDPPLSLSPSLPNRTRGFLFGLSGGMVDGQMERSVMTLAKLGDWQEVPDEPEFDLTSFRLEIGREQPDWFWNAIVRQDIMPVPEPVLGQEGWAGEGVRVVKTGEFFPNGSIISKGDLFSRSI